MSLPTNNKGKGKPAAKSQGGAMSGGSKFINKPGKAAGPAGGGGKKMIKTGGSRGS
ncbi:hypothetical protein [Deminuibacter soli]|uniref:hypothetical protein n=1 Tax=Deminuibacter soli TaxID=2291815 RepID=UPI001314B50D|nr:hypothetical protein [Deminuibacter soli]